MTHQQAFSELLARVREGQAEASAALVGQFLPAVRRAARVYSTGFPGQSRYDSEDIAQSAFLRLFAGLADGRLSFDTPDDLAAWLIRVARNRLIDRTRKEKGRGKAGRPQERGADLQEVDVVSRDPEPAAVAEAAELVRAVGAMLDPRDLAILRLWLDGQGWEEIGRQLGQSPDAARKRLDRAFKAVRSRFSG